MLKKRIYKNLLAGLITFCFAILLLTPALLNAADTTAIQLPGSKYLPTTLDIWQTAQKIIDYFSSFLGLIAVVIILYGGFTWMTAAGNEDKVGTAKKVLSAGVIGLVIIMAAWGIASFVINLLAKTEVRPTS